MHIPVFSRAVPRRALGVTMIELLVVLVIGAILTAMAAPNFRNTIVKYRMNSSGAELLDSLLLAREEARNSGSPVSVCASSNGTACTPSAWQAGHIVFRDAGTAGTVDGTDAVIRRIEASSTGISINPTLQQGGGAFTAGFLQFLGAGRLSINTAVVFTTCQSSFQPLLTAVQFNGSTSTSKGTTAC